MGICILAGAGCLTPAAAAQVGVQPEAEDVGAVGAAAREMSGGFMISILDVVLIALAAVSLVWLWRRDVIRPGSFARAGRRRLGAAPWWVWGLGLLMTFIGQAFGAGIGHSLAAGRADVELARPALTAAIGGVGGLLMGLFVLRALFWGGVRWQREGAGEPAAEGAELRVTGRGLLRGGAALLLALPIVHVVSIASVLVVTALRGEAPELLAHDTLRTMVEHLDSPWTWVMGFAAVVLAPITEELLFRVFLQSMLLRVLGSTWGAVLATSALFAGVHLGAGVASGDAHALAPLLVLGVAMGVAYERTRNMVVPMVMHIGFNLLNVTLALAVWGS